MANKITSHKPRCGSIGEAISLGFQV